MNPYDNVITLHHPEPRTRPRMSLEARAAQFAPFAALVGYDEAVNETARHTEEKPELTEDETARIDAVLQFLQSRSDRMPQAAITHFVPDGKKQGGAIRTDAGRIRSVDPQRKTVLLADGTRIAFDCIQSIEPIENEERQKTGDRNE